MIMCTRVYFCIYVAGDPTVAAAVRSDYAHGDTCIVLEADGIDAVPNDASSGESGTAESVAVQ